jgi:hypothetical protein
MAEHPLLVTMAALGGGDVPVRPLMAGADEMLDSGWGRPRGGLDLILGKE